MLHENEHEYNTTASRSNTEQRQIIITKQNPNDQALTKTLDREREREREGFTGVSHGDLADLIGVEPHLALAAVEHARGEPLLELQGNHGGSALVLFLRKRRRRS